eukprot:c29310_g1_i1 orf=917-1096(-)
MNKLHHEIINLKSYLTSSYVATKNLILVDSPWFIPQSFYSSMHYLVQIKALYMDLELNA